MRIFNFFSPGTETGKQRIDRDLRKEIKHLEKLLKESRTGQDSAQEGKILQKIGFAYFDHEIFDQAVEYWQYALKVYQDFNERKSMAEVYSNIGTAYRMQRDLKAAARFYNKALIIDHEMNPGDGELTSLYNLAGTWMEHGEYQEASEIYANACEISRELKLRHWLVLSLSHLGTAHLARGSCRDAYKAFHEASNISAEIQNLNLLTRSIFGLGRCYECCGDYGQVFPCFQDALEGAQNLQDTIFTSLILIHSARFNIQIGLLDPGRELARRAMDLVPEAAPAGLRFELELLRARIYAIQGMWGKAFDMLDSADKIASDQTDQRQQARVLLTRTEFQLENGHFETAQSTMQLLGTRYPEGKNTEIDLRAALLLGQIYRGLKKNDDALHSREAAVRKAEILGNPRYLWRAYHALGRFHHHQHQYDLARDNYQIALKWIDFTSTTMEPVTRQVFLHAKERLKVYQDYVLLLLSTNNKDLAAKILKKLGSDTLNRKVQHFL